MDSNGQHSQQFRPNNQNGNKNDSNFDNRSRPQARAFKMNVELESPQTDEEDCEMMSVSYYCEDTKKKNRLSRVNVEVELAGIKVNMNMLIDSGSTSSFINPKRLPPDVD